MRSSTLAAVVAALAVLVSQAPRAGAQDLAAVPRIKPDEVKRDLAKLLVVDVRSAEAYRSGHIAGAVNMPGDATTTTQLPTLKASKKPIVTYCA